MDCSKMHQTTAHLKNWRTTWHKVGDFGGALWWQLTKGHTMSAGLVSSCVSVYIGKPIHHAGMGEARSHTCTLHSGCRIAKHQIADEIHHGKWIGTWPAAQWSWHCTARSRRACSWSEAGAQEEQTQHLRKQEGMPIYERATVQNEWHQERRWASFARTFATNQSMAWRIVTAINWLVTRLSSTYCGSTFNIMRPSMTTKSLALLHFCFARLHFYYHPHLGVEVQPTNAKES